MTNYEVGTTIGGRPHATILSFFCWSDSAASTIDDRSFETVSKRVNTPAPYFFSVLIGVEILAPVDPITSWQEEHTGRVAPMSTIDSLAQ
jgi:hypothetical protein